MKTVTVGIIGAGRIGKLHTNNLRLLPEIHVKSVSDVFANQLLDEWAKSQQISVVTDNYHSILKDPEIDAVFICTPTNTHAQIIRDAARAKKHIFCEKPVSFSVEETLEALKVVEEEGVKLQVGFNRRCDPNFKRIVDLVKNNEIGELHILKITSRDPEPPNEEYIRSSGGMFMDMTIHDFDMARFVMNSEVAEVYAHGASLIDPCFERCGDIDTAVITLKFANGSIGVIDNSRKAVYGYDQRIEVFGTKGSALASNCHETTVEVSNASGVVKDKPLHFFLERYTQAYIAEVKEFAQALLKKSAVICNGNDGLQAERIANAAKQSLLTGLPVKIEHNSNPNDQYVIH